MKLLHLGDLHIGRTLGDFDLLEDQRYILAQILTMAKERKVDAVVLAGDIYDRPVPSEGAVRLLDGFLRDLAEAGLAVFLISGNHDSDERLNFGSSFFADKGVFIAAKYQGKLYHREMEDEFGRVHFYLLPFVKASQVRHFHSEAEITNYDEAVKTVLAEAGINPAERNVLVAHQFVAGRVIKPETSGSEGPAVQSVGLVEQVGTDAFSSFDYVALGHIHRPQQLERETLRYAGSPLKYSLSECGMVKSVPLVELGAKGNVQVELLPLAPRRDLRHLTGKMQELIKAENIQAIDDYIYVTLTDEEPVDNAMGILQQYYPNTVKLDYRNSRTAAMEAEDVFAGPDRRSFEELVGEFYRLVYGQDISPEEMAVMRELGAKAGVADETP